MCVQILRKAKLITFTVSISLQLVFIYLFATFVTYGNESNGADPKNSYYGVYGGTSGTYTLPNNYYMFQDVHIMTFVGFGFLLTLLSNSRANNHGLNTVTLYFTVAAICIQWAVLCCGFLRADRDGVIRVSIQSLLDADLVSATVLISSGCIIDRMAPLQYIFTALIEVPLAATNKWICTDLFKVSDTGSGMFVHVFGAYFGLALNFALSNINKNRVNGKKSNDYSQNTFTIGSICLWLLWPSFNACLAGDDAARMRAIVNTYSSLASSCVIGFAASCLVSPDERFDSVLFMKSTLVGGVVIGTSADMMIHIWGSMITGGLAAAFTVFTEKHFSGFLQKKLGINDSRGVHMLHGIPGVLGAIVGAIGASVATKEVYGSGLYNQFPARKPLSNSTSVENLNSGRSAAQQGAYQIAALIVTLATAIAGGLATGILLSPRLLRFESTDHQTELPVQNFQQEEECENLVGDEETTQL